MINRIGQQLGNYRLIQSLGKGGFAEVYLGEHLYLKTFSAIKILQMQLSGDDIRQFMAEGQMLAQLQHPNIIRVLDFGVDHDTPYLVMDYAPNGTLRRRYPPGSILPVPALVSNVKEIALALQYAHDHHVVHRDVKPENMLLGKNNEVLLTDFGIATVIQTSRSQHTQSIIGTVSYMAPEQIRGHPIAASDQYALGITAYEWLCGERPFTGTFVEITTQQIAVQPPPLRQKAPSVPPAVEQIVMCALEKDPQRRFPSVREFANALEYILSAPVQPLNNPSPTQSFVLPSSMPTPTPAPLTPIPPTPRGPLAPAPAPQPAGPPMLVPALPKPDATYIYWPTFALTMQDRQMISSGKLPQDSLRVTGQVGYMTPTSQLPVLQKQPLLSTRTLSQVTVTRQAPLPGYGQGYTGVLTPRPSQPTTGQVVRSSAPSGQPSSQPRSTGAIQRPGQQQMQMPVARTTGVAGTSRAPASAPGSLTPAQLASKRSASIWALTTTLLSMGLFFIQFIVKGNEANTISGQGFSSYQSGIAAVVVFFYILGIIGLITGIVSVARPGIPSDTRSRGNWSIALTIIFMVVEVAMFAWLFS
jgi:serine/threonine protein kinase